MVSWHPDLEQQPLPTEQGLSPHPSRALSGVPLDEDHTAQTTRALVRRRRSSLDTVILGNLGSDSPGDQQPSVAASGSGDMVLGAGSQGIGGNSPDGDGDESTESLEENQHRGTPRRPGSDPDPENGGSPDPRTGGVRALFVTLDGGSLWVRRSAGPLGEAMVTLPWEDRRTPGTPGDGILFSIMNQIGAPLTTYARRGGRLYHAPVRLSDPQHETWALTVDREAMDASRAAWLSTPDRAASIIPVLAPEPQWEYIPNTARESELRGFDSDALTAWSEVSNAQWYRDILRPPGGPATPAWFV